MAIVKKNNIIQAKMSVSFQITCKPTPLIITDFTMIKYHLAGTMFETVRIGNGIFSTGNIKPLNMIVGKNMPINEINMAACCDAALDDISRPKDNETNVNKILSNINNTKLPLIGTSSTKRLSKRMEEILIVESNKYGTAFAMTII